MSLGRDGVDGGRRDESFVRRGDELERTIGVRPDQEAARFDDLSVDDDGVHVGRACVHDDRGDRVVQRMQVWPPGVDDDQICLLADSQVVFGHGRRVGTGALGRERDPHLGEDVGAVPATVSTLRPVVIPCSRARPVAG